MSKLFGDMKDFGAEPNNGPTPSPITTVAAKSTTQVKADEYVLITLDACWADEFDVSHAWTMTREDFDEGVKETKKYFEENGGTEIYFGTNEGLDVDDFDDYMSNLSVQDISKEDYEAFNRMFGGSFGMCDHYFPYGDY